MIVFGTADFCPEIEHWEWRVAAAIGNPRRRRMICENNARVR